MNWIKYENLKLTVFFKTNPHIRLLVSLSITDDKILKSHDNDIENIIESIHYLRENILYMLSFEKLVRDEQLTIKPILNDVDDEKKTIQRKQF